MNFAVPDCRCLDGGSDRPRLLMLTHRLPYPPDKGERIRSYHMLRRLSRHYQVHLASLTDQPPTLDHWRHLERYTQRITLWPQRRFGAKLRAAGSLARGRSISERYFYNHRLTEEIRQWNDSTPFDAALAVCSSMAGYLDGLDIPCKVIDLIDVDSGKWAEYARRSSGPRAALYHLEAQRLAQYERSLADRFDRILVTTPAEAELYRMIAPGAPVTVVPNGVDLDYFQPAPSTDQPVAVFTGVLSYRPNVDGLQWLIDRIWPTVRQHRPDAVLRVVGRDSGPFVKKLCRRDGVELIGPVPDVRPHLAQAAVSVAPLRIARGVQNKVLEAMAMGRPVLTLPAVAQSIGSVNNRCLRTASTADHWAHTLVELFNDPAQCKQIGATARAFVEQTRQWDHNLSRLPELLGQLPLALPEIDTETEIPQAA